MRLIRLRLENFRQFEAIEIDFSDGMTAIVGANGTGKTTLLEAITFALYGEQRDTRDTIRFYWSERRKFLAAVTFEFDGKTYEVERSSTDAWFSEVTANGPLTRATGQIEVRRACEKLLGLNYDQFINSFCAEQKNLGFLNFKSSTARQDEVARMLGFDRLKLAEEVARDRKLTLKAKADTLQQTLGDEAVLKREQQEAAARLKEVQKQAAETAKLLAALEVKLTPALEKRKQAETWRCITEDFTAIRGMADGLKKSVELTQTALKQAEEQVAEYKKLEPQKAEYGRLDKEAKEWEKKREGDRDREKLAAELNALRTEMAELEAKIKALGSTDPTTIEKEFVAATGALERAKTGQRQGEKDWHAAQMKAHQAHAAAEANLKQAQARVIHAKDMVSKGVCPECLQPLGESYKATLEKLERESDEASKALEIAQSALGQATAKPTALTQAETDLQAAEDKLAKVTVGRQAALEAAASAKTLHEEKRRKCEKVTVLETKLAQFPARYNAGEHEKVEKARAALEPAHRRSLALEGCLAVLPEKKAEFERAAKELEDAKAQYRKLEGDRAALPFKTADEAAAAIAEHQKLEIEKSSLVSDTRNHAATEKMATAALASAEKRLEEHKALAKELAQAKADALLHEVAAKELRALREGLNRSIGPDLSARASENLNLLTNGRYSQVELDRNFEPTVVEDGIRKEVISGGEEDVVALALRLALSELIQERNGRPMSLLVLDEVFGALDIERRQSVLERLAALKGRFRQVLVISHIEEINQVADQAIFLRRDPNSRTTTVSDAPADPGGAILL